MNKEKLNTTMNCNCLKIVIEQDEKKHTIDEERLGVRTIQKPCGNGQIVFECFTPYRNNKINQKTHITETDRIENDFCGIPFLYCPLCGTKTKLQIPSESFYAQFQVNHKD